MTATAKTSKKTKVPEAPVTIIPLGTTIEIREKAKAGKAPNPTIITISLTGYIGDDDYVYYENKVKRAYDALEREGVGQIVFTFPEKR